MGYKPQPHAMIWIVKSEDTENTYVFTYENFGYKNLKKVSLAVVPPIIINPVGIPKNWTVTMNNGEIIWQSKGTAPDRMHFYLTINTVPATLHYTLFNKDNEILQSNPVNVT